MAGAQLLWWVPSLSASSRTAQPRTVLLGCPVCGSFFSRQCLCIIAFRTGPKRIWQAWVVRTVYLQPPSPPPPPPTPAGQAVGTGSLTGQCDYSSLFREGELHPSTWWWSRTLEFLGSRDFMWLLPPSVPYMYGQVEE